MHWYLDVFKKYAVFRGRATRAEYWMFMLFNAVIMLVLYVGVGAVAPKVGAALYALYSLVVLLPSLGVYWRRLHDVGKSGWWVLFGFIPVIGGIVLLIFTLLDSQAGDNKYGPNPKGVSMSQAPTTPSAAM